MQRDGAPVTTRPRYPRLVAAGGSALVTVVAVLGAVGFVPVDSSAAEPTRAQPAASLASQQTSQQTGQGGRSLRPTTPSASAKSGDAQGPPAVPSRSGQGRRIVFDIAAQRVWLVGQRGGHDDVRRTYLVSGSLTDNLSPGTYSVYSRSMNAVGIDDSGTMRYFVRFAHGRNAAIGFHDIPVSHGAPVQTRAELGVPRSHGCIRQARPDAQALWRFAPVGTRVVVV